MGLYEALLLFIFYFVFAILADNLPQKNRRIVLLLVCVVLAFMAGFRNPTKWGDTLIYILSYHQNHDLFHLTSSDVPIGYSEMGFFYLSTLIKVFTDSAEIYLTVISAITFFFLYKTFDKYSIYPLFAIAIYLARFYTGRNMMQIRSCIAIAIIVYFTFLIKDKKWWKYVLAVAISYTLHHSALIALPLLLLRNYIIKPKYIYIGIGIALLIGQFGGGYIRDLIQNSEFANDMASTYIQENSERAWSNNLTNPVIWYQIFILFAFTFFEKQLKPLSEYYYIFRNGYFYSTCILIVLCQFAILAGRSSTIFATFEVAMVPMLLYMFGKKERLGLYLIFGIAYIFLFYMNWPIK